MKILSYIGEAILDILGIVFFVFLLLYRFIQYLVFLIITPFKNKKHLSSRYQRDFPTASILWHGPHIDSVPYTVIKDNELPIEYIKQPEAQKGYFVYKNILIVFDEPLIFYRPLNNWLLFDNEYDTICASVSDEIEMDDFFSQPLALEDAKVYLLQEFHKNIPERKCEKIVFFYKKDAERGETPNFEDIVIYEKDSLDQAIKDFIKTH